MMENRIYQMIALCQKARQLVAGEFAAKQAVLEQEAKLVIIAEDASHNTKNFLMIKVVIETFLVRNGEQKKN